MQISRHWRLNAQRYRLEGVKLQDGSLSLQKRFVPQASMDDDGEGQPQEAEQIRKQYERLAS